MHTFRVILLGGSSNVGKSTLAKHLAEQLGWHCVSTDSLARHPGRPWSAKAEVPRHVAEHYLSLSVDELIEDVLRHYRSMQPQIETLIQKHATDHSTERLVLEGSALWPEFVATLNCDNIAAIWLTASDELFKTRIYNASQIDNLTGDSRTMVEKFLARTLRYNQRMLEVVNRLGLANLNVESASSLEELSHRSLEMLQKQREI